VDEFWAPAPGVIAKFATMSSLSRLSFLEHATNVLVLDGTLPAQSLCTDARPTLGSGAGVPECRP
jgi:hypothetical protein